MANNALLNNDNMLSQLQFMVVPSMHCPAKCYYCFGPNRGSTMTKRRLNQIVRFIKKIDQDLNLDRIKISFHGGEPLAAGFNFFQTFLDSITCSFLNKKLELNIQSNLWLLDKATCDLFKKYHVSIGTSLDGPEHINDLQRGDGYFKKTMQGIELARKCGLEVGCIATFTSESISNWKEIIDFFVFEQLNFSVHTAVPALKKRVSRFVLNPNETADLYADLIDYYIQNRKKISISNFNQMAKSILIGKGDICTFADCLGMFLVFDGMGDIYPCQRFCGNAEYRLGNLDDDPSKQTLFTSLVARKMKKREQAVKEKCQNCRHYAYCKGGCCYNAWADGNDSVIDPFCLAYAKSFDYLRSRLLREICSEENISAIIKQNLDASHDMLLKKGPLIDLIRSAPHPYRVAKNAKRIVAAVELARGPDENSVAKRLIQMGICQNLETATLSLFYLKKSLTHEENSLNNLYLHLTFRCQLHCMHCYACAGSHYQEEMPLDCLKKLIYQAKQSGFRQVVITGGEPLIHSKREKLLSLLNRIKAKVSPMKLVLRTNLAMCLTNVELKKISLAFHQVVVSIDGTNEMHDTRRGIGTYRASVANLEQYQRIAKDISYAAEISIAATLSSKEMLGEPGLSVKSLAHRLGVHRVRFRPLLPLGRVRDWEKKPKSEALSTYIDTMEIIQNGFRPIASCGIGQNLYVDPSGESFPCYAYHQRHAFLGNVFKQDLYGLVMTERFRDLSRHNVDTNSKCKQCEVRYLCGGACRAWGGKAAQNDLDISPTECTKLKRRAWDLYHAASDYLEL